LKINYISLGKGSPMLILHGWGSKSERWQKFAEIMAQNGYKVIAPDLPGFGQSQSPETPWTLNNYVDWVEQFIKSFPELSGGFYLVGHSFGGAIASKIAIKYPQQPKKLFLVAAACVRKKTPKKLMLASLSKIAKVFSFLPFYAIFRKAVYRYILRKSDYISVDGIMKETFKKVVAEDLSLHLGFIKVPTIIIWGDKDETTPLWQANIINKKIRKSKLIIVPGGHHNIEYKLPEALSENVLANI